MQCICSMFRLPVVGRKSLFASNVSVARRCLAQKTFQKEASILDSLYSDAEKEKILDTFNRCNEYELQHTRQLNHHKASSIVRHRKDNGNFQTLSDILLVPGVGILGIQKICNVLRTLDYETLRDKTSRADFDRIRAEPNISEKTCQLHLIKDKLPEADIYVMERKVFRNINPRMVPFLFNMKILDAMLFTLLNSDFESSVDHKIYMVAPTLVSQFFGLSVGGERVSGQHVLQDIERMQSDVASDVNIPYARWDTFKNLNNVQKEKYANSLLLGVAFYKLIVLRSHRLPL
ncbi:transcription elongation factor, mitochondrial-like isoform X3 [Haliotis rubra]|uniref:transcription elongation factor, mitochondrial-like isoform X3 n=1 Tax=Haliotis rubra TaxID=36100 RepID=UPI001EE5A156|nr:transcription elongation factor, mitochondrial-like isoform X3 [Haliotis rubra]